MHCALVLMQYGAESVVVVNLTQRLGRAMGADDVACALSFNAVILTTICHGHAISITQNTMQQNVNVAALMQIQNIVSYAEKRPRRLSAIQKRLILISSRSAYSPLFSAFFMGLSCAAFAYLNGASLTASACTLLASALALHIRTMMTHAHFNPFIIAIIAAFVASMVAALSLIHELGTGADVAMAAAILLLVPSFPIINALSDILKGYINMGVGRWVHASMLTVFACVGITLAISILDINRWGVS